MDYLLYITFIFVLIIKYVIASVKGQDTSILFLSNTTIFNYNDITELVVFGYLYYEIYLSDSLHE